MGALYMGTTQQFQEAITNEDLQKKCATKKAEPLLTCLVSV